MTAVQLHLVLTHIPVHGILFSVALLAIGLIRGSHELNKVALWAFTVFAVLSIPLYLTGEPAEEAVEHLVGINEVALEAHEDSAMISFTITLLLGVVAFIGALFFRRRAIPKMFAWTTLALAIITSGFLIWTASLGGKVRHTEIDSATSAVPAEDD